MRNVNIVSIRHKCTEATITYGKTKISFKNKIILINLNLISSSIFVYLVKFYIWHQINLFKGIMYGMLLECAKDYAMKTNNSGRPYIKGMYLIT